MTLGQTPTLTAVILCEGAFATRAGKPAHGLVRVSRRYRILGVIDSTLAGGDAGEVLDGKRRDIPIVRDLAEALVRSSRRPDYLIIGIATEGGRVPHPVRLLVREAMERGLGVVSGLSEPLSKNPEFERLAIERGVGLVDVRKEIGGFRSAFTGEIELVGAVRIAILGTDRGVGKRTTAVLLTDECNRRGLRSVLIGTGATAWIQGVSEFCVAVGSTAHEFVTGSIEAVAVRAWKEVRPDVMFIEGYGAVGHPGTPGGLEIIAGSKPHAIVLQHAPGRPHRDGFPDHRMPDLGKEIRLLERLSKAKVQAIAINPESLKPGVAEKTAVAYERDYGVVAGDPAREGAARLVDGLLERIPALRDKLADRRRESAARTK